MNDISNWHFEYSKKLKKLITLATILYVFSSLNTYASPESKTAVSEQPTAAEAIELKKHSAFSEPINIITTNEHNGIFKFLEKNQDKVVFLDTAVLRYEQLPDDVLAKGENFMPPTDRFENHVVKKCWGNEINMEGLIESGQTGFPLPLNDNDVEKGCKYRIKFNLKNGDYNSNFRPVSGLDKMELFFAGFFTVSKSILPDSKVLYTLTYADIPTETQTPYFKYKIKKDRTFRPLGVESKK